MRRYLIFVLSLILFVLITRLSNAVSTLNYGLKEGDLISASAYGDPDIFIINDLGYKRLFLNPVIFGFYGHLGGFYNVKNVTPEIRDFYITSGLFRNCEANDSKVYGVEVIGEDAGNLHWVSTSGEQAVKDDPDFFQKVFCINNNEFNWYPKGKLFSSAKEIPLYYRGILPTPTPPGSTPTPIPMSTPTQTSIPELTPTPLYMYSPTPAPYISPPVPEEPLRIASILDIPIPANSRCFTDLFKNLPECAGYYYPAVAQIDSCPMYLNPVYDQNGTVFPSACWAEKFGIRNYSYGYSDNIMQFVKDLWLTPKKYYQAIISFKINQPSIIFNYKTENNPYPHIRSTLWLNTKNAFDLNVSTDPSIGIAGINFNSLIREREPINTKPRMLLAFVMFDNLYSEQALLSFGKQVMSHINDTIRARQHVANPLQYDVTVVTIPQPEGISRPTGDYLYLTDEQSEKLFTAALAKANINRDNIQSFAVINVFSDPNIRVTNYYSSCCGGREFILTYLMPLISYFDSTRGLNALSAFRGWTLYHEVSHRFSRAHHNESEIRYGNIDPITAKYIHTIPQGLTKYCQDLTSLKYYPLELPDNGKILVGHEPSWINPQLIINDSSGPCIFAFDVPLKDYDGDGEYEMFFERYQTSDVNYQKILGFADIDGDGIAEIEDPDPYDGHRQIAVAFPDLAVTAPLSFESLGPLSVNWCLFEHLRLENGEEGLLPLQCKEFNSNVVNIYRGLKYKWSEIKKDYGTVLLPRL